MTQLVLLCRLPHEHVAASRVPLGEARRQAGTAQKAHPSRAVSHGTMAARAVSLGGVGAALSAEDVLRVACGAPFVLDVAIITKLERDATAPAVQNVRGRAFVVARGAHALTALRRRLWRACATQLPASQRLSRLRC